MVRRRLVYRGRAGGLHSLLFELHIGASEHFSELEFALASSVSLAFARILLRKKSRKSFLLLSFY